MFLALVHFNEITALYTKATSLGPGSQRRSAVVDTEIEHFLAKKELLLTANFDKAMFLSRCDVVLGNRLVDELGEKGEKVFTRDLLGSA